MPLPSPELTRRRKLEEIAEKANDIRLRIVTTPEGVMAHLAGSSDSFPFKVSPRNQRLYICSPPTKGDTK